MAGLSGAYRSAQSLSAGAAQYRRGAAGRRGAGARFLLESQLTRRVNSLVKEVRMSKPRLIASLLIALAVVGVAGWWSVKTFWLVAPLGLPTETVVYAYGSAVLPGGSGASALVFYLVQDNGRNGFSSRVLGSAPIKGPVPHLQARAPLHTPSQEG